MIDPEIIEWVKEGARIWMAVFLVLTAGSVVVIAYGEAKRKYNLVVYPDHSEDVFLCAEPDCPLIHGLGDD